MSIKRNLSWLKQGWTTLIDPFREDRLENLVTTLQSRLNTLKRTFDFVSECDTLEIADVERHEIAQRLFGRIAKKAWKDGDLTEQEERTLDWVGRRLGMSEDEQSAIMGLFAQEAFSSAVAVAFADGILSDDEYAHLERIAESCGKTAGDFFRHQFREDGEAFIRQLFLKVWEDGKMDSAEWEMLKTTLKRLSMTLTDFHEAIKAPAQQLVEHFLTDFKSDEVISQEEGQFLEWMLNNLIGDQKFVRYVRDEITRVNMIAAIRRGTLPSITPPSGIAIKAGEITHYSSPTAFVHLRRRGGQQVTETTHGTGVVTDNRLLFVSPEHSLQLSHSSIIAFHQVNHGIQVQTSGKGAGLYVFSDDPDIGTEIWIAAIGKANQVLIAPMVKDDMRKIGRDVRQRVWQRYGGRCAECNASQYLEFDHIIPVARGGGNSENNIQLLCRGCNSKKSDKI